MNSIGTWPLASATKTKSLSNKQGLKSRNKVKKLLSISHNWKPWKQLEILYKLSWIKSKISCCNLTKDNGKYSNLLRMHISTAEKSHSQTAIPPKITKTAMKCYLKQTKTWGIKTSNRVHNWTLWENMLIMSQNSMKTSSWKKNARLTKMSMIKIS